MSLLDKIKSWFGGSSAGPEQARDEHVREETATGAGAGTAGTTPPVADVGRSDVDDEGTGAMSGGATAPDPAREGYDPLSGEPSGDADDDRI